MLNQWKQLNLVYSAAAGLFLRGIFWVSARERPLSFWWRFTADHRTELHCQDAHDNHSFCLIAIAISFHSFYYRPRYSLANLLLKDTWWRLLNNKTEIICQSQQLPNITITKQLCMIYRQGSMQLKTNLPLSSCLHKKTHETFVFQ